MCFGNKRRGFTLLEVVISVAIIAMIALTLYRFIESNLRAIAFSTQQSSDSAAMDGLIAVLQSQLDSLPREEPGALLGDAHQFSEKAADEMTWLCGPGNGLFTRFAAGRYHVTLTLQPVLKSSHSELGFRRVEEKNPRGDPHWLRLLADVDALEIRYFDQQLNAWLEKWTNQGARPSLVRLRIWRAGAEFPVEVVLSLPTTRLPALT
ncbi:MAG: hypothetical protein QOD99_2846 [Chthoniobacter sp.]|jgi:prepilin-type N-terminal cleavage/methylation domain-containing protein|nr:hypothetical protein [Chthoniobacter sp.]